MTLTKFGARLRSLREDAGMSQQAVADAAGIHNAYVSRLEAGLRNPDDETLVKLADAFRVKDDVMFIEAGRLPMWLVEALDSGKIQADEVAVALAAIDMIPQS